MKVNNFLKKTLATLLILVMLSPIMGNLELNIKEVRAEQTSLSDFLDVKCQVTNGIVTDTEIEKYRGNYVMRFVSSVESLDYKEVGFKISYEEDGEIVTKINKTKTVFTKINSTTGSTAGGVDTYTFSPKVISTESQYFITAKLPVAPEDTNVDYTVWAFARTVDGKVLEGAKRCVSVNDGFKDCKTINMSIQNTGNVTVTKGDKLKVNTDFTATVIGVDGNIVHVRISDVDKENLQSVTKFVFTKDEVTVGSGIYRNLYSEYTGTADKSWYEVYAEEDSTQTKFTIASSADLYGLAAVVDGGNTLTGKTIYMVSDIEANEGRATESGWSENATPVNWMPVGFKGDTNDKDIRFAGTFDGQGHTISGVYFNTTTVKGAGLFATTAEGAVLKNFRLENSYFTSSVNRMGSIVGNFAGRMENVYSNAYVNGSATNRFGGLLGCTDGNATISNCWYNGILTAKDYVGGIVGCVQSGTADVVLEHCLFDSVINITQSSSNVGGICGVVSGAKSVKIDDSLGFGTINIGGYTKITQGSVLGQTSVSTVITNTYGNKTYSLAGSTTNVTATTGVGNMTPANYLGINGLNLQFLDFENYWVAKQNTTPKLKSMVDSFMNDVTENADGQNVYTLDSAEDLYEFAMYAQKKTFAGSVVQLGADIVANTGTATEDGWTGNDAPVNWTPIGYKGDSNDTDVRFAGIFDGQGHTISGVYFNTTTVKGAGLFATTAASAVLKGFRLENSYFESSVNRMGSVVGNFNGTLENVYSNAFVKGTATNRFGGLVAQIDGKATITNCWYDGTLTGTDYVGGIAGCIQSGTAEVTIEHCLFDSTITIKASSANVGGICGVVASGSNIKINDTLGFGTIDVGSYTVGKRGSILGKADVAAVITNSYGNKTYSLAGSTTNVTATTGVGNMTPTNYLGVNGLNLQFLDFENYWVAKQNTTPKLKSMVHSFMNDATTNAQGQKVYKLATSEDLYEFAMYSQKRDFANSVVKVTEDIVANEGTATEGGWTENSTPTEWLPIGQTTAFAGTFDGLGNTISGVCANSGITNTGLFGKTTTDSIIQNLRLENSYFKADGTRVGSIVGSGSGKLYNVYSNAHVVTTKGWTGGVIGFATGSDVRLEQCWFDGTVTNTTHVADYRYTGGIIGEQNSGDTTIKNCLNTGTVNVESYTVNNAPIVGGFIGHVDAAGSVSIESSVNTGLVVKSSSATYGYGRFVGLSNGAVMVSNSYATTNNWDGNDTNECVGNYEIVSANDIKGANAEIKMPLLNWGVWECGTDGEFPCIIFSEETIGQEVDYAATTDDQALLTNIYSDWNVYYGDMHAHADDDARIDETQALTQWKQDLIDNNLDFAASLDHKQTNHIDNTVWQANKNLFLYGTEAGTNISDISGSGSKELHYNMLFNTQAQLTAVLDAFESKYQRNDGTTYVYGDFNKTDFGSLIAKVKQVGGLFVIPHPTAKHTYNLVMEAPFSDNLDDYYFGQDFIGFEVIYTSLTDEHTVAGYKAWKELLADGRKYWATAGSDIHGSLTVPDNPNVAQKALTSVYAAAADSEAYMEQLTKGNFTAGSVGVKMCIGNAAMGAECDFTDKRLVVEIGDFHEYVAREGHKYRVDIITDKGVIYSQEIGLTGNAPIALDTDEDYQFYRVEVIDENDARRIAYGNPIWNTSK